MLHKTVVISIPTTYDFLRPSSAFWQKPLDFADAYKNRQNHLQNSQGKYLSTETYPKTSFSSYMFVFSVFYMRPLSLSRVFEWKCLF